MLKNVLLLVCAVVVMGVCSGCANHAIDAAKTTAPSARAQVAYALGALQAARATAAAQIAQGNMTIATGREVQDVTSRARSVLDDARVLLASDAGPQVPSALLWLAPLDDVRNLVRAKMTASSAVAGLSDGSGARNLLLALAGSESKIYAKIQAATSARRDLSDEELTELAGADDAAMMALADKIK